MKVLQPALCLDPTPKLDRLCQDPVPHKVQRLETRNNWYWRYNTSVQTKYLTYLAAEPWYWKKEKAKAES